MKQITLEDANLFWQYLDKHYPDLGKQFPSRAFAEGAILFFRPGKMNDKDWNEAEGILNRWIRNNGFF